MSSEPTSMQSSSSADNPPTHQANLQRHLSNRHIQLIAIGGAIGTGLFMGAGKTIHVAGPSILLVYALIGFSLFFVMRAMGELLLSNSDYGTFADFSEDLLGPWAGFFIGWTYWFCWVITGIAEIVAIVGYVKFWGPGVPSWIPALITILVVFGLNAMTVKLFGETEFWFSMIKVVAIIALIVTGTVMVIIGFKGAALSHLWDHGGFFPTGFAGFMQGFQIAIFAFVGIELVGTTAGETADPEKNLPKAINSVPIRVVLFYVLALAAIMCVTPWDKVDPAVSPFVNLFELVGLVIAAHVVNAIVLSSAATACNSGVYSTARMLYGRSKRHDAPKLFDRLSANKVPLRALTLTAILLFGSIGIMSIGGTVIKAFTLATTVAAILFMFVWTVIVICYIVFRLRYPHLHQVSKFKLPGGYLACGIVFIFMLFSIFALWQAADTRQGLLAAVVWFVLLGIGYGLANIISPEPSRRRAAHAERIETAAKQRQVLGR